MTEVLHADTAGIARAAALLRQGKLVAFPTETVYGLGADATDDLAVASIYEAKGRPLFNPLIAHVPDFAAAERLALIEGDARILAEKFWPGPLTLVLPRRDLAEAGSKPSESRALSHLIGTGLPTVAIRVPALAITRQLLAEVGRPVAGPSANPSGRVSPTTAAHVLSGLSGKIAAVLDAGPCTVGVESTIVGFDETGAAVLLRPGGLPVEEIEAALGQSLGSQAPRALPNAPGQLSSHYAPEAPLRLNATAAAPGETLIGFGAVKGDVSLSETGDLVEAAARLFGMLREMDRPGVSLAVAPIPSHGLGRAIQDRLARAAAPRG